VPPLLAFPPFVPTPHAQGPNLPQSPTGHLFENVLLVIVCPMCQKTWTLHKSKELTRNGFLWHSAYDRSLSGMHRGRSQIDRRRSWYLHRSRVNFPASRTIAIAIYGSGHRLDEASCKNQAEGYREYFHRQSTVTRDRLEEALVNESVSNVFDW